MISRLRSVASTIYSNLLNRHTARVLIYHTQCVGGETVYGYILRAVL